jgi:hypothetical protein
MRQAARFQGALYGKTETWRKSSGDPGETMDGGAHWAKLA